MRRLEFDRDQVVEKAMHLFWLQGYHATTVDHLLAAMGIRRSSFYNTFGGKQPLFLEVLDKYRAAAPGRHLKQVQAGDSCKDVIRKVFREIVDIGAGDPQARGCLLINSIIELAASHPELGPRVAGDLHGLREILIRLVKQAQSDGEISRQHTPQALAEYLANAISGLRVMSKAFPNRKTLRNAADVTLSLLDK